MLSILKLLRGVTDGVITIDPGYKNTGACQSAITFLDGEKGILRYRGYSIEDLAEKADFLRSSLFIDFWRTYLPKKNLKISCRYKENAIVDDDVRKILDAFPKSAHPMGILSSLN